MIDKEQFDQLVLTLQNMNNTVGMLVKEVERLEEEKQILATEVLSLRKRMDELEAE